MKHPSYWASQFPDFPEISSEVAAMRHAGLLADISYSNDACPSFVRIGDLATVECEGSAETVPVLWVDHPDASKREFPEQKRFVVGCVATRTMFETDDEQAALRALMEQP